MKFLLQAVVDRNWYLLYDPLEQPQATKSSDKSILPFWYIHYVCITWLKYYFTLESLWVTFASFSPLEQFTCKGFIAIDSNYKIIKQDIYYFVHGWNNFGFLLHFYNIILSPIANEYEIHTHLKYKQESNLVTGPKRPLQKKILA